MAWSKADSTRNPIASRLDCKDGCLLVFAVRTQILEPDLRTEIAATDLPGTSPSTESATVAPSTKPPPTRCSTPLEKAVEPSKTPVDRAQNTPSRIDCLFGFSHAFAVRSKILAPDLLTKTPAADQAGTSPSTKSDAVVQSPKPPPARCSTPSQRVVEPSKTPVEPPKHPIENRLFVRFSPPRRCAAVSHPPGCPPAAIPIGRIRHALLAPAVLHACPLSVNCHCDPGGGMRGGSPVVAGSCVQSMEWPDQSRLRLRSPR